MQEKIMRSIVASLMVLGLLTAAPANAADDELMINEGVQSFQQNPDAWRRGENRKSILPRIADSVGKAGIANIENSEQIFCYELANRPADYDGYSLNGMALTGFCGVINDELKQVIADELLMNENNVQFDVSEDCVVKPKIMLRFVRGVDYTDVMLSSPCHSFAIFYGGKVRVFNAKPGAEMIDTLVNSLQKNHADFVSPALLNQLLPIGVAQTQEQKDLVNKRMKPIRDWENEQKAEAEKAAKKQSGWNNLNLGI